MNISAIALGGLQQAQAEVERASKQVASSGPGTPVDAISLSHEAVALMVARSQFDANISALNAAYEAEKTLLESTGTPSF
jgi:FlaG/FlaF family flagellin (archaellin)